MIKQTRRRFLTTLSLACTTSLVRAPRVLAAEGPPLETTAVRIAKTSAKLADSANIGAAVYGDSDCWAPENLANELLYAEGFTDVRNVEVTAPSSLAIGRGEVDFALGYGSVFISAIDAGQPITVLAGVQVGCIEVFAKEGIHTIADLNGKRVGVQNLGSSAHVLFSIMCAQIGLDPAKDIRWISGQSATPFELFVDGRIDAYQSSPPASLDMRARGIGHVILNTTADPIFLLHAGRQSWIRAEISGGDQAGAARHFESSRFLLRRAGASGAPHGRGRLHSALRLCAPDVQRGFL